jgi:hypothetical protein
MQSIVALAGVVGFAAAAVAPAYGAASTEAAYAPVYPVSSEAAGFAPSYNQTIKTETAAATAPVYYTSYSKTVETVSTSAYVTYCPTPTTLVFGTEKYTVTSATTLTITACANGCAVTKEVAVVKTTEEAATIVHPTAPAYAPVKTEEAATIVHPTAPVYKTQNTTTAVETAPAKYTGAATKVGAGAFAIVAGLVALL